MLGFVDMKMFAILNVLQTTVAYPAVRVDITLRRKPAFNDSLKLFGRTVRNQFGINRTIPRINAEHRLFNRSPPFYWGWPFRKYWCGQRNAPQLQPY